MLEVLDIVLELVVDEIVDDVELVLVLVDDTSEELVEMVLAVDDVEGTTMLVEDDVEDTVELDVGAAGAAHVETEVSFPE